MSTPELAFYVRQIIEILGYDLQDPHLRDSPDRIARYLKEWHTQGKEPPKLTTFAGAAETDQMIVQTNIPFDALCAHHGLPFHGTATIGYIPRGDIIGLSKFARVLDHFANRYTVQERVTAQVAEYLDRKLTPVGLGVVLTAEHHCMKSRGVKKRDVPTTTTELRGAFKDNAAARAEFLSYVRRAA